MEDSDQKDLGSETLHQQYELVKNRTANTAPNKASNVMQFGELSLNADTLSTYMGASLPRFGDAKKQSLPKAVKQRDADLAYFWSKLHKAPEGSAEKVDAHKRLHEVLDHCAHVDSSIAEIGVVLLGTPEKSSQVLNNVRASGQPLVDDWDCLKSKVRIFESHCGKLLQYGMKHTRAMANMCNSGVKDDQMTRAATLVCSSN
ncbi:hypothetical protein RD792_001701 [Penstemon davidsonii]|uniref:Legumain prodomain domain-containing protein n=1 Tax=Penstemon davidsonii TaxID=160366 RepID=A0ABR0DP42_9LAMI|nr:hypothetical protein RD792_001701 [Penstemon davidsonii]